MRWFRRGQDDGLQDEARPEAGEGDERDAEDLDDGSGDGSGDGEARRTGLSPRPDGPWDAAEQDTEEGYVDLGGMRLRGREGMELRLDVEEATGVVTAATVQLGRSAVQLQVFAAPRSEGIWSEIRAEIADGITAQGGTVQEQPGVFGPELLARIPVRSPEGGTGHQPARFAGVDGPRWFLRAVFHGEAVDQAEAATELESVVRDVVVVRGGDAMAPRELLPLRLPREVTGDATAEEPAPDGPDRTALDPFRRGPEITERR